MVSGQRHKGMKERMCVCVCVRERKRSALAMDPAEVAAFRIYQRLLTGINKSRHSIRSCSYHTVFKFSSVLEIPLKILTY